METIKTYISIVSKERDNSSNTYQITASTSDVDRHGEIVDIDGIDIERFKSSPRILANHEQSIESIIGIADADTIKKVGGKLKMSIKFASDISPLAEVAEKLVKGGYLNTLSIGFISKAVEMKRIKGVDVLVHTKSELLEVSLVAVPANPNAIINPVAKGMCTSDEFKEYKKNTASQIELNEELIKKIDVLTDIHEDKKALNRFFSEVAKTVGYQPVGDLQIDTSELSNIIKTCLDSSQVNLDAAEETPESSFIDRYKMVSELYKF